MTDREVVRDVEEVILILRRKDLLELRPEVFQDIREVPNGISTVIDRRAATTELLNCPLRPGRRRSLDP